MEEATCIAEFYRARSFSRNGGEDCFVGGASAIVADKSLHSEVDIAAASCREVQNLYASKVDEVSRGNLRRRR